MTERDVEFNLRDQIERERSLHGTNAVQLLDSAEFETLIELIHKKMSRYVAAFELAGLACEVAGDHLAATDRSASLAWYRRAKAEYKQGMHYATGSGEGWQFRTMYDAVSVKMRSR
jgi:hypothetical protein